MTLTDEGIVAELDRYDKEAKALKNEALKLSWYMRGGLTYDDAMFLSQNEREMIGEIIKENIEITKKSGLPFY